MNIVSPEKAAAIAERAYFIYLNRLSKGIPGDEHKDWLQAVAENDAPPAAPMGAKTSRTSAKSGAIEHLKKAATISETSSSKKSAPKKNQRTPSAGIDLIKGIGPKIAQELVMHGICSCADLAILKISDIDKTLPKLAARARREKWLQQAKKLASK